jgi:hypothetical protein
MQSCKSGRGNLSLQTSIWGGGGAITPGIGCNHLVRQILERVIFLSHLNGLFFFLTFFFAKSSGIISFVAGERKTTH